MEDLTKMVDEKLPTDVNFLDFSKAFDSVPHARLLSKLNSYVIVGIHGSRGFCQEESRELEWVISL